MRILGFAGEAHRNWGFEGDYAMRQWSMALGAFLLLAGSSVAQINVGNTLLLTSPSFADPSNPPSATVSPDAPPAPDVPWSRGDQGPGIHGVYGDTYTQVSVGYTYFRFYQVPGAEQNLNGVNASAQYYLKDWVAADGEAFGTFGSLGGQSSNFVFIGGGARVRHVMHSGIEVWAHGLVGYAHFNPSTIFGRPDGVAFETGGGVDFGKPHKRWGYRLQADLVGSYLFGSYQYSPKVSAGLVFKL